MSQKCGDLQNILNICCNTQHTPLGIKQIISLSYWYMIRPLGHTLCPSQGQFTQSIILMLTLIHTVGQKSMPNSYCAHQLCWIIARHRRRLAVAGPGSGAHGLYRQYICIRLPLFVPVSQIVYLRSGNSMDLLHRVFPASGPSLSPHPQTASMFTLQSKQINVIEFLFTQWTLYTLFNVFALIIE